jgi:tetratricopeptide (TPR) repeat protein
MKKTLLPILLALLSATLLAQNPQVTVQDDAKVGLIVTGTGNTINTTQIFGKSPEYAEIKKALATLESDILKKADQCAQMAKDSLPAKYREGCRAELIALNARRDSVQKVETRFREDVIRLAETFSNIKLNTERLQRAKRYFDEGKIREADNVLNASEMKTEGDALLAEKAREQENLCRTDSLLRIKADEFALKARLKAADFADSLRYDSAQMYFEQSRRYAETVENLRAFAYLLGEHNQQPRALEYIEKALKLSRSESEEADLAMNLGSFYYTVQKMPEAERMYLRSLEIFERLAKTNPAQFELDLAALAKNLGKFYYTVRKMQEAERLYLRSLEIFERLAKTNPAQFEPGLARTAMALGLFYATVRKMPEAERLYLRALEIYERLAKASPAQFEPDLAMTAMNLGLFYATIQKMPEAERLYLRALEIYERLAKASPV